MESISAPPLLPAPQRLAHFYWRPLSVSVSRSENSLPNVALGNQAGPVAPPVAASPARALVKEFVAVFQRGFDFALVLILDPGFPLVADQPTGDKIVVVSIQDPLSPFLILKSVKEVMAGEDL